MLGEIQNHEIPKNVRNIATERKIDPSRIFKILEDALLKSLVCVYGKARLAVEINHDSGAIFIMECRKVVPDEEYDEDHNLFYEEDEDCEGNIDADGSAEMKPYHYRTINLTEAKKINKDISVGDMININIPNAWTSHKHGTTQKSK